MDQKLTSMNVSLPEAQKLFVDDEVAKGGYSSASEFIRTLIRSAQCAREHAEMERRWIDAFDRRGAELSADERKELLEAIERRREKGQGRAC